MPKPQYRGNSAQVTRTIGFNLNNPDERLDYEFSLTWYNFAGRIKEFIRACRIQAQYGAQVVPSLPTSVSVVEDELKLPEMDEAEALRSLT